MQTVWRISNDALALTDHYDRWKEKNLDREKLPTRKQIAEVASDLATLDPLAHSEEMRQKKAWQVITIEVHHIRRALHSFLQDGWEARIGVDNGLPGQAAHISTRSATLSAWMKRMREFLVRTADNTAARES